MIEHLIKETLVTDSIKNKISAFNPDKRINPDLKNEIPQISNKTPLFNPDKRIKPEHIPGGELKESRQLTDGGHRIQNDIEIGALKPKERELIKKEKGWSDVIIDHIDNMEQYDKVYKDADLKEMKVNDRPCLVKNNLDLDYVDPKTNKTNRELISLNRNPYDSSTGEKLELHHMNQKPDAPFAELTKNSEHGDGNHKILHPSGEPSWRKTDPGAEEKYNKVERPNHWSARAEGI